MLRSRPSWGAVVLSGALVSAACGNDESSTPASPVVTSGHQSSVVMAPTPTTSASSPPESAPTSPDPTSVDQTAVPADETSLRVEAIYLPVCGPTVPTDPTCAPLLLDGVEITVRAESGETVAVQPTGADGTVMFALAPGSYLVEGAGDPRAHIAPKPQPVTVVAGIQTSLRLAYASAFQ